MIVGKLQNVKSGWGTGVGGIREDKSRIQKLTVLEDACVLVRAGSGFFGVWSFPDVTKFLATDLHL